MVVELTLLPIAMIVVFLRMYVRISWLRKSWWDDYLMIAAMVSSHSRHGRVAVLTTHRSSQLVLLCWSSWRPSYTDGISTSMIYARVSSWSDARYDVVRSVLRHIEANGLLGVNGWPNPLRTRVQYRQDVYSGIILPHCTREVSVPEVGLGYFRFGVRRIRRLLGRVVGAVHVRTPTSIDL